MLHLDLIILGTRTSITKKRGNRRIMKDKNSCKTSYNTLSIYVGWNTLSLRTVKFIITTIMYMGIVLSIVYLVTVRQEETLMKWSTICLLPNKRNISIDYTCKKVRNHWISQCFPNCQEANTRRLMSNNLQLLWKRKT